MVTVLIRFQLNVSNPVSWVPPKCGFFSSAYAHFDQSGRNVVIYCDYGYSNYVHNYGILFAWASALIPALA